MKLDRSFDAEAGAALDGDKTPLEPVTAFGSLGAAAARDAERDRPLNPSPPPPGHADEALRGASGPGPGRETEMFFPWLAESFAHPHPEKGWGLND